MKTRQPTFEPLPASAGSAFWRELEWGGVEATHDAGDETGAIITTARVVQGGNGLWTPCITQYAKGRPKKVGQGRIASKCVACCWPGQRRTKDEAVKWCEEQWAAMQSQNDEVSHK